MKPLLEVRQLKKYYFTGKGASLKAIKAVDNISFTLFQGETFGLAGESGCGKSTLAKTLLRLMPVTAGEIFYGKDNITHLSPKKMLPFRKKMQIVLQDPYESLNPQMTIGDALVETLKVHKLAAKNKLYQEMVGLLEIVGLNAGCAARYPHELSGGQCQRVVLARALALKPELIIFDEPFSSLDVSVQAQIINLLQDLQTQYSLTYMFISHDLSLVK
ncbi:MAG TPA: ABC transporter ATP-binding protein, partial [Firmicutes bacterium]|nr:ABC transporter ATP-binding protein [Bacillota bacterium]